MFPFRNIEFSKNTRFSDSAVEYEYFLRFHYLGKETFVYAETFRIF
jgi:hypothetical protein